MLPRRPGIWAERQLSPTSWRAVQSLIELRSQGASFARIAKQLGVAKSTLINCSREHQHLIQNLRAIEWEDFADRTLASKQERLKALAEQLRRLDAELAHLNLGFGVGRRACDMPLDAAAAAEFEPPASNPDFEAALRKIYGANDFCKPAVSPEEVP